MTISATEIAWEWEPESWQALHESPGPLIWCVDAQGQVKSRPAVNEPASLWLGSDSLEKALTADVDRWLKATDTTGHELFPGCAFVPVARADRKDGAELTVAMIIEPGALDCRSFASICEALQVDCATMREGLAPFILTRDVYVRQLSDLVSRSSAGREQAAHSEYAAGDLAKHLADSYEQISFLYRLSREMTTLDSPRQFVSALCRQLHHLLEFQWIAVKYIPGKLAIPGLEHDLIVEGDLACPAPVFSDLCERLIGSWHADDWTRVVEPEEAPVAALVGSQIVIEKVTYDDHVIGAILAGNKMSDDPEMSSVDSQLLDAAAGILGAFHLNVTRYEELRSLFMGTVRALTATVDAKDPYTRGHSDRVAYLARNLALSARLSEEEAERVFLAGVVHDVGKIGVPEAILRKPGKLESEEFDRIKAHPITGFDILKDISQMADVLPGVLHHHERWDGKGYPHGIAGEQIPLVARMLALPDAFDAMSSNRAYRPAMPRDTVLQEIENCAATPFDPHLARLFARLDFSEYDEMVANHRAQDAYAA